MGKKVLVVGVGSPHGVDSVGWLTALAIKEQQLASCDVRIAMTPADLLDWLDGYETVHVCDACRGAAQQPTVHRWVWPDGQISKQAWSGTHDMGLASILQLASELATTPPMIILWGLEVPPTQYVQSESSLSDRAEDHTAIAGQLVPAAVARIVRELE